MSAAETVDPQELNIDCGYLRLAARRWGDPQARPVIALHGWLDNAATFDHLAPCLHDIQLIALDLPGHGRSDHRGPGSHYHFVDFIADVINAADALGLERYALLGHSLGAAIASMVAAVVPGRISHLALIEGVGPFSGDAADAPSQLMRSIKEMNALRHKRAPVYCSLEEAADARRKAGDFSMAAAVTLAGRGTVQQDRNYTWRSDPQLRVRSPLYLSESQVVDFLKAVRAPSLLIRATRGLLPTHPEMEARVSLLDHIEVHTLEGGHHLHLETPQPVAAALNPFFARSC